MARLVAALLAFGSAIAAPATALAHGHAHHEASEHAAHHGGPLDHDRPSIGHDDHEAHAHQGIALSTVARAVQALPARLASITAIEVESLLLIADQPPPAANESPPDPQGVPPAPSRAPPTLR